jgi:membrane-associated phospholipid phosphatase
VESLKKHSIVWVLWAVFMLLGAVWLLLNAKGDALLYLNVYHNEYSLQIFHVFTRFGEWYGAFFVGLYLLINKPSKSLIGFALLLVLTLVFVWFFKQVVFPESLRPVVFFRNLGVDLPVQPDYHLNSKYSFPSGHTTGVFAYFCYAAFWASSRRSKILFMVVAFLGGLSRVFLIQHFVEDIMAGSLLGIVIAFGCYRLFSDANMFKAPKLEKPIFKSS